MSNMSNNNVVSDGTASFAVRDKRLNTLLDILYPIGSVKITVTDTAPFKEYGFGTWEEVSKGRVLWGADDSHAAGSTIEAGLPNITAKYTSAFQILHLDKTHTTGAISGALSGGGYFGSNGNPASDWGHGWDFDASRCSPVYGKSTTVTPLIRRTFLATDGIRHVRRNRYASITSLDSERRRNVWGI